MHFYLSIQTSKFFYLHFMKDYDNFQFKFKVCFCILLFINLVMLFAEKKIQNFSGDLVLKDYFIYTLIGFVAFYLGLKIVMRNFLNGRK